MGTTVVLGWDGLDYELVKKFNHEGAFGSHITKTETIINAELGKPHTQEVWPSIITGLPPEEHGFEWMGPSPGRAEWKNPTIDYASRLAENIIPKQVRSWIGAQLQDSGAELSYKDVQDYAKKGIDTVFDGRTSFPITIPNYRTELDQHLGLETNREGQLGKFVNLEEKDGQIHHHPKIPLPELELRLAKEAYQKLGIVHTSTHRKYDIIFVWLGFLDTIGHLDPITELSWQKRGYRLAAKATRAIRSELTDEDTLICVSDHGLQNGEHTHDAFFGINNEEISDKVESVLDIKWAIEQVTSRSAEVEDYPPVRESFQSYRDEEKLEADEVRGKLEDLGYL